jgi:hypothetical protein
MEHLLKIYGGEQNQGTGGMGSRGSLNDHREAKPLINRMHDDKTEEENHSRGSFKLFILA